MFLQSAQAAAAPLGDAALAVEFDAADPASVEALVETTLHHFGRLDILHNNAAMTDPAKHPFDTDAVTIPIAIWDEIIDINLRGYLLGCKYAIPHMVRGGGRFDRQHRIEQRLRRRPGADRLWRVQRRDHHHDQIYRDPAWPAEYPLQFGRARGGPDRERWTRPRPA